MRFLSLVLAVLFASGAMAQAPQVASLSPSPGLVVAERDADIVVTFDRALDAATISEASVRVFGRWSGVARGTLQLENGRRRVRFSPSRPFMAGETVTVSVSRDVTSGGVALASGFEAQFWTRAGYRSDTYAVGEWIDIRRPGEGSIISYGAYAGDLDGDGDSDLAVPNELPADVRVFLNDGSGGYGEFTVHALPNGNWPSPSEGADLDHDGAIDLVVGNGNNDMLSVLMGDGEGAFSSVASYPTTGNAVRGIAVVDADGDGHDDVVTTNRDTHNMSLFMGRGDGTFSAPVTLDPGGRGATALASGDANGDGILDLFVGAINSREVILMLGDGVGGFTVADRVTTSGAPWMLAAGDLDGDGDADVVSAGSYDDVVDVVLSDGATLRAGASLPSGTFTIAVDLGDLDGDGDLDLVSSNYNSGDFVVYAGDGAGGFTERQRLAIDGAGSCAVLHDRDGDGVLDITAIDEINDRLYFVQHVSTPGTEPEPEAAVRIALASANPASGDVRVRLQAEAGRSARVTVSDVLGREVAVLHDGPASGERTLTWRADAAPGLYLVRMEASSGDSGLVRVVRL